MISWHGSSHYLLTSAAKHFQLMGEPITCGLFNVLFAAMSFLKQRLYLTTVDTVTRGQPLSGLDGQPPTQVGERDGVRPRGRWAAKHVVASTLTAKTTRLKPEIQ